MKAHIVVEKDEKGYFVAEVPALPGCLSQGKTYEEAVSNIGEAIQGCFETMESREPMDAGKLVEIAVRQRQG